ncbi:MAG: hypothetical protein NC200_02400 [Candidatus Gastranaerophilales bacterium]|nr:hypothetical protein [Candidatus Gastranaerophilales bacterium]
MAIEMNKTTTVTNNNNVAKPQQESKKESKSDSKLRSWATGKNIGIGAAALSAIVVGGLLLHGKLSSKTVKEIGESTKTIVTEDGILEKELSNGNFVRVHPKQTVGGESKQLIEVYDKDGNLIIERQRTLEKSVDSAGLRVEKFSVRDDKVGLSPEVYDCKERLSKKVYNSQNELVESCISESSSISDKNGVMTSKNKIHETFMNEEKNFSSTTVREGDTITSAHSKSEAYFVDDKGNKTLKEIKEHERLPHDSGETGSYKNYHSEIYVEPNRYDVFNINANEAGTHYNITKHSQTANAEKIADSEILKTDIPVAEIPYYSTDYKLQKLFS